MRNNTLEKFNFSELDEIIHARLRLGIMAALVGTLSMDFSLLKKKLETSDGNLSVHLKKLEEAGYIKVKKAFIDNKPCSTYSITEKGRSAFDRYVEQISRLV